MFWWLFIFTQTFFFLLQGTASQTQRITSCSFYGNNFLQWSSLGTNLTIQASVCDTGGWGGVSIHNGSVDKPFVSYVYWEDNGQSFIQRYLSHQGHKLENATEVSIPSSTDVNEDSLVALQFRITDLTQHTEKLFVTFVCSSKKPKNFILEHHDLFVERYQLTFDKNNTYSCIVSSLGRFSDLHIGVYFAELIVFIIVLVLLFYYREESPLKSRGLVPIIAVLSQYATSVTSFDQFFLTLEWRSTYSCYFLSFLAYPTLTITYLLMPFNFFRYVLIIFLNNRKEYYSNTKNQFTKKFIAILNYLATPVFTILLVSGFYLAYCLANFFILMHYNYNCFQASKVIEIVHFALNTFLLLSLLFVSIFDIINYMGFTIRALLSSENKCKIFMDGFTNFIYKEDPYLFRLEQTLAYVVVILYLITDSLYLAISNGALPLIIPTSVGRTFIQTQTLRRQFRTGIVSIRSLIVYFLITHQILFSLGVTMIVSFLDRFRTKKSDPDGLERIFSNEKLSYLFKVYAKHEWSLENYLIYLDLKVYKKLTGKKKEEAAKRIMDTYLNGSASPLEVNLDNETLQNVRTLYSDPVLDKNLFTQVEAVIRINLLDTYYRFIFSSEYLNYVNSQEFLEKELVNI